MADGMKGTWRTGLYLLTAAIGVSAVQGAYLIEVDTDGLDDGVATHHPGFSFGGDTTQAATSAASSAFGLTGGDSIFGGNGSGEPDTYVYSYCPDTQADNLFVEVGTPLGDGDFATGSAGGGPGRYALYATWNASSNVSGGLTNYHTVTAGDGDLVSVDQNGPGGQGSLDLFGNVWVKVGEVDYVSGPITVTQTPSSNSYVSMRAAGLMFELLTGGAQAGYEGPPGPVMLGQGTQKFFGIAFDRSRALADSRHHAVLRSTDLKSWSTSDLKLFSVVSTGPDSELVTFRSMSPVAGQSREFLKVEARPKQAANAPFCLALTYDDGPYDDPSPDRVDTRDLLDTLAARGVRATFYVLGERVQNHPGLIRRMINEGHEIGNHSYDHARLTDLTEEEVVAQVNGCRDAVVAAATLPPLSIRPTYGAVNDDLRTLFLTEWGYPTVLWEIDPRDWDSAVSDQEVVDSIINGVADWYESRPDATTGPIILLHDIHQRTIRLTPVIVDTLLQQGYSFVTVSEMLELRGE